MKIIVSAGGTGGHIYPALAIIDKIKSEDSSVDILYIGTLDRMESKIVPSLGIKYEGVSIKGLNRRNVFKNFEVFSSYVKAKKRVRDIISSFNPDVVLGIGGYITLPVVSVASSMGIKTFIHEQNSIPGLSNRLLSRKVDRIGVSFEDSMKYFPLSKTVFTGNPRSEEAIEAVVCDKKKYGLSYNKKLVLIVMGSLGSFSVSNIMMDIIPRFNGKKYEVLFVTGKDYFSSFEGVNVPSNVKLVSFIDDMLSVLKVTDLIVTRAGASTIAEITALGIPSIMVPSPYVTHNHQLKNALVLADHGASVVIQESELNSKVLIDNIDEILSNSKKYDIMKKASSSLGVCDSASKIYEIIKNL